MRKKLMSLLLVIALCASLLTIGAAAIDYYSVAVTPIDGAVVFVTSENANDVLKDGGSVTYDAESNTLKLNNATVARLSLENTNVAYALEISGENLVTDNVNCNSSLTLKGDGSLKVTTNTSTLSESISIYAGKGLCFESGSYDLCSEGNAIYSPAYVEFTGTAHVTASAEGNFPAICGGDYEEYEGYVSVTDNAYVEASGNMAAAVDGVSINITGGTLVASSDEHVAIYSGSDMTITGGKVTATSAEGNAINCSGGDLSISGGEIYAESNSEDDCDTIFAGCSLYITGGKVTAIGNKSNGIFVDTNSENVAEISGDALVNASSTDGAGIFINSDDFYISDSAAVNAESVNGNGIWANGRLTISDSASVTAKSTNDDAIYATWRVTTTGADVTAVSENASGISTGQNVEISGGANVSVSGGTAGIEYLNATSASNGVSVTGSVLTVSTPDGVDNFINNNAAGTGEVSIVDSWADLSSKEEPIIISDSVVFRGGEGAVVGEATVPDGAVIPEGSTLTIPEGGRLTVPENVTLTNNGKVVIEGTLDNEGSYADFGETEGTVTGDGELTNYWYVTLKYGNGASDEVRNIVRGKSTTLPTATRSGYAFLGWACSDGKTYSGGETVAVTSDLTFTASWVRHPDTPYVPEPEQPEEPETPAFPFYDVPASAWYYTAVKYVYENKLMDGVDTYVFAPNDTLTRAMVWTIIARMSGVDTTGGATWYAKAQEWVVAKGISDGENPTAAITREEFVTMLWRLAGEPVYTGDLSRVPDAGSISAWAQHAMLWAYATGLVEGDETGAITPTANANRAAAAALIMRYLEA